jgi:V8-like Glu-specific endopeptidase
MRKSIVLFAASLLATSSAFAADIQVLRNDNSAIRAATMPTANDYITAKGVLPSVSSLPSTAFDNNVKGASAPETSETGHKPTTRWTGPETKLFDHSQLLEAIANGQMPGLDEISPNITGTGGIPFTLSQAFPSNENTTYPYSTTGKLWFTISGAWYVCSGSMIKPGIVATAGHCVHSGNNSSTGWYSNWQFIPGYRNGAAPYGTWTSWAAATTTSTWYSGGGAVPNDADYALIVFNKNSSGYRIGDYTGWLGYAYPYLIGKHITELGYPQNLDSGVYKERADSNANQGGGYTGIWGSYMMGGSSGGPIMVDFGLTPASGAPTSGLYTDALVSVVSYGYTASGYYVQGGSQFDSRFGTLLSNMCTSYAWAC